MSEVVRASGRAGCKLQNRAAASGLAPLHLVRGEQKGGKKKQESTGGARQGTREARRWKVVASGKHHTRVGDDDVAGDEPHLSGQVCSGERETRRFVGRREKGEEKGTGPRLVGRRKKMPSRAHQMKPLETVNSARSLPAGGCWKGSARFTATGGRKPGTHVARMGQRARLRSCRSRNSGRGASGRLDTNRSGPGGARLGSRKKKKTKN